MLHCVVQTQKSEFLQVALVIIIFLIVFFCYSEIIVIYFTQQDVTISGQYEVNEK